MSSSPKNPEEHRPPVAGAATLAEVARSYLRLGLTAFGGPAAHIAFMRSELVVRRGWVDEQELVDIIGGASLLPGPTSTEVALMLARRRKGWWAFAIAGACFIIPSMLAVLALTWAYVRFGTTDAGNGLLFGVKPVVVAIIADALVGLGRTALKTWITAGVAVAGLACYLLGLSPLAILLGAAVVVALFENRRSLTSPLGTRGRAGAIVLSGMHLANRGIRNRVRLFHPSLYSVFIEFLKLGSIVFGSGYVLVSYLRGDLVANMHWLTESQLLASIAIGQVTPGPVFTTATSVGYLVGGLPGALLATLAIFAPSFVLVALLMPLLARARRSSWSAAALDGVNAAAVALMVGVTVQLATASLVDWLSVLVGLVSLGLLVRWRVNSTWLVLGGAAVGLLHAFA
ncbi:MAG: chromate efflux transporter [Acidimicrobiales bacterium]|jgi:chromate transporter